MKTVLQVLALLAGLPLLPALSARLRGSVYDAPFLAADLAAPPVVRVGLGGAIDVPTVSLRVEGPVRVLDAAGLEVLWEGRGLAAEAASRPGPPPGIRLGPRLGFPGEEILVVPARDGAVRVGGRRYRGAVRLLARGPQRLLTAVNEIGLEPYLWGVVGSEMRADWPPEALKAQAVAARTYALWEVASGARRRARGFDLYDDDSSQVYPGTRNETSETVRAARETHGEVCTFGGKAFKAFYQNTCGGGTEPARIVFGEQAIPPLEGRACAYCDRSPHFRWRVEVSKLDLAVKLFASRKFGPVPAVRIRERTPGGLVLHLGVVSPLRGNREIAMTGKEFRSKVDPRRFQSLAFEVADAGDRFVFEGRGWGHRVGLCQEGAKGFAERVPGATYRQILEYYYPGVAVERAY